MTFAVDDRVILSHEATGHGYEVQGTVVKIDTNSYYVHVKRDDGEEGSGKGKSWLCFVKDVRLAPTAWIFPVGQCETVPEKGYVPDGFDAEAHRSFMKTLGGGS